MRFPFRVGTPLVAAASMVALSLTASALPSPVPKSASSVVAITPASAHASPARAPTLRPRPQPKPGPTPAQLKRLYAFTPAEYVQFRLYVDPVFRLQLAGLIEAAKPKVVWHPKPKVVTWHPPTPSPTPPPSPPSTSSPPPTPTPTPSYGGLAAVVQCIKNHESGNYSEHSHPSSGSGAYQFIPGTWQTWSGRAGLGGYVYAYLAPPWVQDAVLMYALTHGGAGNWSNRWGNDPCTAGLPGGG